MSAYIIYRKSDRVVAGISTARSTPALEATALAQEIQNVVNSTLNGTPDDYGTIEVSNIRPGLTPVVNADLTVTWEVPAERVQREANRDSLLAKIKAAIPGITDEELDTL